MSAISMLKNITSSGDASGPQFTFQRMGGLDQVTLQNDEEWQNLDKLDPKLWLALSCPIKGLEFNSDTLQLLDTDNDGRIRANEVKEAVAWICQRVKHPSKLREETDTIQLDNMREDTPEGEPLIRAAKLVLQKYGKAETETASLAEIEEVLAEASGYAFNGDGIVPPASVDEEKEQKTRDFIDKALSIVGGKRDASGLPGLDKDLAEEFYTRLEASAAWRASVKHTHLPLGENTGAAWTLIKKVGPKLDDFFARCRLAQFAPDAIARINGAMLLQDSATLNETAPGTLLNPDLLLELPISRIDRDGILNLEKGLNPAWQKDVTDLAALIAPMLDSDAKVPQTLSEKQWLDIKQEFAEFADILDKKPVWPAPDADATLVNTPNCPTLALAGADDPLKRDFLPLTPTETIAELSDGEISAMLSAQSKEAFTDLTEKDLAAPPLAAFQELRKLALFHGHLNTFLRNFLSFLDFYDPDKKAIFQTGVLYLDSRSCLLCVPVDDVENHARLAAQSHLCLVYCECSRKEADGAEQKCLIASALTEGNLVSLIEGRHGLFIDNDGKQWDSKILRIIHNPISLREAVWAPYIRISNMIGEQVQKFIAAKDKAVSDFGGKLATAATTPQAPAAPKQGFDFAKGAGIFAALSVALSVLSAAFAYIAKSVASLGWWWPLALLILFICISGPSVIMAWFKLRRRTLGPLLDASGWAVNKGAPINLVMGAALTALGKLPPNAKLNLDDPYGLPALLKAKKRRARFWTTLVILLILAAAGFWLYCHFLGEPYWVFWLRAQAGI